MGLGLSIGPGLGPGVRFAAGGLRRMLDESVLLYFEVPTSEVCKYFMYILQLPFKWSLVNEHCCSYPNRF